LHLGQKSSPEDANSRTLTRNGRLLNLPQSQDYHQFLRREENNSGLYSYAPTSIHIFVIGAGIIGLSVAMELGKRRLPEPNPLTES
jgi:hypothetical protein